ncbi:hypothetical protein KC320_g77 [Hortaea werneckii]|nr:hypothetical protein KC320_g77 [Hortaea werneckii]
MDRDLTSLDICLAKHMSLRRLRSTTMRWIQPKNTTLISAYRKREGWERRAKAPKASSGYMAMTELQISTS